MRRPRFLAPAALLLAAAIAVPALALGQATPGDEDAAGTTGATGTTGPDFKAVVTADKKVTSAVRTGLEDGRLFLQPGAFGDLTADGKSDAVVLATVPGAAGAVAAYVLSADGRADGELRVIYRSQSLHRAFVRVGRGALVVLTPEYARGDDVCCPAARLERTYVYDRKAKVFRRTGSRKLTRGTS